MLLTDDSLINFIKSGRISEQQVAVMKTVLKFIWIALVALILSGIYLALTKAGLGHSSKFLVKVVAVGVLTINGVFLNVFITPRMTKIAFKAGVEQAGDEPDKIRKMAMAAGGISAFSWVIAFLLGKFKAIPASFGERPRYLPRRFGAHCACCFFEVAEGAIRPNIASTKLRNN